MEFSRDGNNIIRCVISEEEIEELGYTIDDIISNGSGQDFDPIIAEVFLDIREKVEAIHNEINNKAIS